MSGAFRNLEYGVLHFQMDAAAVLPCSFHRCSSTGNTKSQTMFASAPTMPRPTMNRTTLSANGSYLSFCPLKLHAWRTIWRLSCHNVSPCLNVMIRVPHCEHSIVHKEFLGIPGDV